MAESQAPPRTAERLVGTFSTLCPRWRPFVEKLLQCGLLLSYREVELWTEEMVGWFGLPAKEDEGEEARWWEMVAQWLPRPCDPDSTPHRPCRQMVSWFLRDLVLANRLPLVYRLLQSEHLHVATKQAAVGLASALEPLDEYAKPVFPVPVRLRRIQARLQMLGCDGDLRRNWWLWSWLVEALFQEQAQWGTGPGGMRGDLLHDPTVVRMARALGVIWQNDHLSANELWQQISGSTWANACRREAVLGAAYLVGLPAVESLPKSVDPLELLRLAKLLSPAE